MYFVIPYVMRLSIEGYKLIRGPVFSLSCEKGEVMKQLTSYQVLAFLAVFALTFTGCEIVGDIFQAGMWVGVIVVAIVVSLVVWLINKARS